MSGLPLHRTSTWCCDCQTQHAAAILVEDQAVFLDVDCPREPQRALLSNDAATFRAVRDKSALLAPVLESARGMSWINFLEITSECNCDCPICYADAGGDGAESMSVAEVERIARRLKAEGLKAISLTGGEPTLHPELLDVVRTVRGAGLDATLISNGLRLGQDAALAKRLRESGLTYLYLQLDTLREEICQKIRGDRLVALRQQAMEHVRQSGVPFGVNTTVIRDNLEEVPALLQHATRYAPHLNLVTFLTAARTGRFLLGDEVCLTREDIIAALVSSGLVEGLSADHFWPFPRFAPMGLDVHPDCGVNLMLALDRGRLRPLDHYVDVAALFGRMSRAGGGVSQVRAGLQLSSYFLRSVRPRQLPALTRMLRGLFTRKGDSSIITVVIEQFSHGQFQDQERLDRCTSCVILKDGKRVPLCVYQHNDPRRSPDTRIAHKAAARQAAGA